MTDAPAAPFRNRIVAYVPDRAVDQLTGHPRNARIHPTAQQEALRAVLKRVGLVGCVIESVRSGYLVDGHDRVMQALREGQATLPCLQVDLDDDEELEVLTGYDALAAMAVYDRAKLSENLADLGEGRDEATRAFLADLARRNPPSSLPFAVDDPGLEHVEFDAAAEPEPSHVRMVQLFLTTESHPRFMAWVAALGARYGTANPTDTIYRAVAEAAEDAG